MAHPLTDAEFDTKVLQSSRPVLVDFWAPWCGPCKAMLPIVEEISTEFEGKADVYKMNVDEQSEISAKFGVMSIPTFMIFKNGEMMHSFIGVKSKEDITAQLSALL